MRTFISFPIRQGETAVAVLWRRGAFHSEKYSEGWKNYILSYILKRGQFPVGKIVLFFPLYATFSDAMRLIF